ncbi:hypothetical protein [Mesorhizobium sp.]|uniref:hypothetical protein n=1 Tax=Mesorhizobium sp. TaxID=1871066 RepID=UPI0025ED3213|nr:hypothetical protein [Mesorhizobium sp.]
MVKDDGLRLPPPRSGRAIGRAVAESAVEEIPLGGLLTKIWNLTHPPREQREQEEWREQITQRTNDNTAALAEMADQIKQAFAGYIRANTYQPYIGSAGRLSFFRGGMLRSLMRIARGTGQVHDLVVLREQLAENEVEVAEILQSLRIAFDKLVDEPGSIAFIHALDTVLNSDFDKMTIRRGIEAVTSMDISDPAIQKVADTICRQIWDFNRAVVELGRFANGKAA